MTSQSLGQTFLDEIKLMLNTSTVSEIEGVKQFERYALHRGRHTGKWFGQYTDDDGEIWQTPMCESEKEAERVTRTMMGLPQKETLEQDQEGWW